VLIVPFLRHMLSFFQPAICFLGGVSLSLVQVTYGSSMYMSMPYTHTKVELVERKYTHGFDTLDLIYAP
jgi:hypothetical protein